MTGILAQVIAIVTHGNDYLKNDRLHKNFETDNSTFQFCNHIHFTRVTAKPPDYRTLSEIIIAEGPTAWFHYLKANGCRHLRLYYEDDADPVFSKNLQLTKLVPGGSPWLVGEVYDNYSNYYSIKWELLRQKNEEKKVANITYSMIIERWSTNNIQIDSVIARKRLTSTLDEISSFALEQNLNTWHDQFKKSKEELINLSPGVRYDYKDILPQDTYSLESQQLLFAAGTSWLFNGDNLWHDIQFTNREAHAIHDKLSQQLASCINCAIIAVANSY